MIKVTADRALRGNIHTDYILDILMDLETNQKTPFHFTFFSLQFIQMSCFPMIHTDDQVTVGNSGYTFTRARRTGSCTTEAGKQKQRHTYRIL